jgi:nucleotide-binding universal stress UspA family protein
MKPFRKILFPIDFSEATTAMVPSVREMAERFNATVTVVNAFNLVREYSLAPSIEGTGNSEPAPILYSPALQELRYQRERSLDEFARTQFSTVRHSTTIEDGDPALVIRWVVQRENTDLIMMPTKGLGRFRRLLLGSVTAKVLHDVTCPVLTSAHQLDSTLTSHGSYRSILCAVDLNSEADSIFRTAAFLAQTYGAKICLLHIDPSSNENGQSPIALELRGAFDKALNAGKEPRGGGHELCLCALGSSIPEGIRQIAIKEGADLVVVGRGHIKGTFSQAWSHLYRIIRESPCPVLSV